MTSGSSPAPSQRWFRWENIGEETCPPFGVVWVQESASVIDARPLADPTDPDASETSNPDVVLQGTKPYHDEPDDTPDAIGYGYAGGYGQVIRRGLDGMFAFNGEHFVAPGQRGRLTFDLPTWARYEGPADGLPEFGTPVTTYNADWGVVEARVRDVGYQPAEPGYGPQFVDAWESTGVLRVLAASDQILPPGGMGGGDDENRLVYVGGGVTYGEVTEKVHGRVAAASNGLIDGCLVLVFDLHGTLKWFVRQADAAVAGMVFTDNGHLWVHFGTSVREYNLLGVMVAEHSVANTSIYNLQPRIATNGIDVLWMNNDVVVIAGDRDSSDGAAWVAIDGYVYDGTTLVELSDLDFDLPDSRLSNPIIDRQGTYVAYIRTNGTFGSITIVQRDMATGEIDTDETEPIPTNIDPDEYAGVGAASCGSVMRNGYLIFVVNTEIYRADPHIEPPRYTTYTSVTAGSQVSDKYPVGIPGVDQPASTEITSIDGSLWGAGGVWSVGSGEPNTTIHIRRVVSVASSSVEGLTVSATLCTPLASDSPGPPGRLLIGFDGFHGGYGWRHQIIPTGPFMEEIEGHCAVWLAAKPRPGEDPPGP